MGAWESGRRRLCCCRRGPPSGDGEHLSRVPALLIFLLVSSVPLAIIASLERSAAGFTFQTPDWICECAKWDPVGRSFLVSTFLGGSVARLTLEDPQAVGGALTQRTVLSDPDVAGNASLGMAIDRGSGRRRILVVYADLLRCRSSSVAAYDLESWSRIFLTHLSGPGECSYADDVAVDDDGNAYVTDAKGNRIWKVGLNGELISVIRSQLFAQRKEWYYNIVGLNGIVYHPDGYLLVIHTASGHLFRVNTTTEEVTVVQVRGSLLMGDGMELISPNKLVIAGTPSARVIESFDGWETANVTAWYIGPMHRIASSATVKDGRIYLNHLVGVGMAKKTHVIAEAVFLPSK
ncbi:uncharacterized protein LOC121992448 [Zingiber officinale]|uniref:Uncharacterized protein n=1 Tax=Zingiber officinale TaxID=94328 RepID=A0A8J5KWD3_ZINOF|nr:uncharacterized protein LOC121992448 [Zingiber officinale]KAG6495657.1 hypothetical protein ZIOFF_043483 [Zingiber officinale]